MYIYIYIYMCVCETKRAKNNITTLEIVFYAYKTHHDEQNIVIFEKTILIRTADGMNTEFWLYYFVEASKVKNTGKKQKSRSWNGMLINPHVFRSINEIWALVRVSWVGSPESTYPSSTTARTTVYVSYVCFAFDRFAHICDIPPRRDSSA